MQKWRGAEIKVNGGGEKKKRKKKWTTWRPGSKKDPSNVRWPMTEKMSEGFA